MKYKREEFAHDSEGKVADKKDVLGLKRYVRSVLSNSDSRSFRTKFELVMRNDDDVNKFTKSQEQRGVVRRAEETSPKYHSNTRAFRRLKKDWESLYNKMLRFDSVQYEKDLKTQSEKKKCDDEHNAKSQKERRALAKQLDNTKWQLKGAARPAEEVYDFDKRFKDVHAEALEESKASYSRQINLLTSGTRATKLEKDYFEAMELYVEELFVQNHYKTLSKLFDKGLSSDSKIRTLIELGDIPKARELCNEVSEVERFSLVLFEFVSLQLEEEGASEDVLLKCLEKCLEKDEEEVWRLGFGGGEFDGRLEKNRGYAEVNRAVWDETEGAIDWLRAELGERGLEVVEGEGGWKEVVMEILQEGGGEEKDDEEEEEEGGEEDDDVEEEGK